MCVVVAPAHAGTATFRGDAQHSGVYESGSLPTLRSVKWKFETKGQVISSPAVADGTVFVGSTDNRLYAVDRATGVQRWVFDSKARITSSPAVANGVVYFGSYDGSFYAVDAKTGTAKWTFATGGERRFAAKRLHGATPAAETMPDPFDFYLSSPVVVNGLVYFGSGDGNVYALDAASGALKWKVQTGDVVHASPAVADGLVFVGSWDSYFYALDAKTGAQRWRFKTGEDAVIHNQVGIQSSAAVVDGIVYFGCRDSKFYAVDAKSGQQVWAFDNKGSWVITSPAVRGGRVYFATSDTGLLHVLDAKSGAPVTKLDFSRWPMFSSPALVGDTLFIGSHAGKVLAIDLKAQSLAATFQTEASKLNGPALTKPDGTPNYAAAFRSGFYDDMVSGVQRMMSVGAVLSSPVVADGVIYFGSTDGNLYAVS